jgi:hypothetical protein
MRSAVPELFTAGDPTGLGIELKYNILRSALDWHNIKSYVSHPSYLFAVGDLQSFRTLKVSRKDPFQPFQPVPLGQDERKSN